MTGVNNSLACTGLTHLPKSSLRNYPVSPGKLPLQLCEENIAMCVSPVDHNKQGKVTADPPEAAESDSGDSLFITQNPVPAAVRSRRRHQNSFSSDLLSPTGREESEDDSSSSASQNEFKLSKGKEKKINRLPKFSFPFLSGIQYDTQLPRRTRKKPKGTRLTAVHNAELHNFLMGGFFKSISDRVDQQEDELESPTLYMDNEEDISPLSE